jgi:hypothetical protein
VLDASLRAVLSPGCWRDETVTELVFVSDVLLAISSYHDRSHLSMAASI